MSEESWIVVGKHCEIGGATSELVVAVVVAVVVVVVVAVFGCCFAWFSEKHCLFIAMSEGSLSDTLISDLLPVGVVVVNIVVVGGVVVVVVDAVGVVAAVVVGVGVCARPLLLFSLSSEPSSSLFSCWYISSTMGFHNRTRALMNQFETYKHIETSTLANIAVIFNLDFKKDPVLALDHCEINIESSDIPKAIRNK
jgi:hypothetical protein